MPIRVRYVGAQTRYREIAVTGKPGVWNPGESGWVPDADAPLLIGTGAFVYVAESASDTVGRQPDSGSPAVARQVGGQVYSVPLLAFSSGTSVTAPANTAENTLQSFTLPGGSLGANGFLRLTALIECTDSAGTKTFWFRIGGVNIMATVFGAGNASAFYEQVFFNRNSQSANGYQNGNTARGPSAGLMVSTSINTAIDQTVSLVAAKSNGADSIICRYFAAEVGFA